MLYFEALLYFFFIRIRIYVQFPNSSINMHKQTQFFLWKSAFEMKCYQLSADGRPQVSIMYTYKKTICVGIIT